MKRTSDKINQRRRALMRTGSVQGYGVLLRERRAAEAALCVLYDTTELPWYIELPRTTILLLECLVVQSEGWWMLKS